MVSLVPAIDRAIRVLYLFKEGEQQEYGVSEISRLLGLNKSTAHNILNTLTHHHFLVQNETTRRYRLGPALPCCWVPLTMPPSPSLTKMNLWPMCAWLPPLACTCPFARALLARLF